MCIQHTYWFEQVSWEQQDLYISGSLQSRKTKKYIYKKHLTYCTSKIDLDGRFYRGRRSSQFDRDGIDRNFLRFCLSLRRPGGCICSRPHLKVIWNAWKTRKDHLQNNWLGCYGRRSDIQKFSANLPKTGEQGAVSDHATPQSFKTDYLDQVRNFGHFLKIPNLLFATSQQNFQSSME